MATKMTLGELEGFKNMAQEIRNRKLEADLLEKIMNKQLYLFDRNVYTLRDREMFEFKLSPEQHDKWMEWGVYFLMKNSNMVTVKMPTF